VRGCESGPQRADSSAQVKAIAHCCGFLAVLSRNAPIARSKLGSLVCLHCKRERERSIGRRKEGVVFGRRRLDASCRSRSQKAVFHDERERRCWNLPLSCYASTAVSGCQGQPHRPLGQGPSLL
ncbi:unnamed protein product, partial [Ectocarpus sp. 4 AP-2014]